MKRRGPKRKLSLQSLEHRHLLAAATFSIHLYESIESGPGEEIFSNEITNREAFYVEISAIENDSLHRGIGAVALNVQWDPASISLVEEDFDLGQILNSDLPLFRAGSFDQAAGRIYDLRASQIEAMGAGRPIGDGEVASVAMIHFKALGQASESSIRIWEGASEIVPVPYANWQGKDIEFETQNISIVSQAVATVEKESTDSQDATLDEQNIVVDGDGNALLNAVESDVPDTPAVIRPQGESQPGEPLLELGNSQAKNTIEVPSTVPSENLPRFATESIAIVPVDRADAIVLVQWEDSSSEPEPPPVVEERSVVEQPSVVEQSSDIEVPTAVDASIIVDVPAETPNPEPRLEDASDVLPPDAEADAEIIDEVLSFDLNLDGIFDLADFGLLNVLAAQPAADTTESADLASTILDRPENEALVSPMNKPETVGQSICTAAPPREDAVAFEAWIDALADAWIADADARQRQNDATLF